MIISATQFKLKRLSLYGKFFAETYRVVKQLRSAAGLINVRVNPISLRTITAWRSREDMLRFRNTGAHLHAMKVSRRFGQIVSATWASDRLPTWTEAKRRLARSDSGQSMTP